MSKIDVDKTNSYIEEIDEKIDNLEVTISHLKDNKKNFLFNVFKNAAQENKDAIQKLNYIFDTFDKYGFSQQDYTLRELYEKAFYYICGRRKFTDIEWGSRSVIVFNTRGLAYTSKSYSGHIDKSHCYNFYGIDDIIKITNKHYDDLKHFPLKERRFVFDAFHDLTKKWKKLDTNEQIYESNKNFDYIRVSIENKVVKQSVNNLTIRYRHDYFTVYGKEEGSYWSKFSIDTRHNKEEELYILSTLPEEALDCMVNKCNEIIKIHEYNQNLIRKFADKASTYILAREL